MKKKVLEGNQTHYWRIIQYKGDTHSKERSTLGVLVLLPVLTSFTRVRSNSSVSCRKTHKHTHSQLLSGGWGRGEGLGGAHSILFTAEGLRPTWRQSECVCAAVNEHTLSICLLANANFVFFIWMFVAV